MPDSSAYFVLPDREICQDYLQSNKKVRSRNSLAWSWTLRPNGTSCAQKAASYRLRRYGQSRFTMELGRTHSLQGRVWEGEEGAAVTGKTDSFFWRNPSGCRNIDSKNHKTVPNINSCDRRGLIRYWSECSHRHRSQKLYDELLQSWRTQSKLKKTFKSIPNINWKK